MQLFDKKGKKTERKIKLDEIVFNSDINNQLISLAVFAYLQNQRQANAHTKNKSEVSGGGKKPWRQKGTGRARHGSTRSPIWTGGGVTFGPTNERNYKKKINKKARQEALRDVLSLKNKENSIIAIEDIKLEKTKDVEKLIKTLGLEGSVAFIQVEDEGLHKAVLNIGNARAIRVGELNVYNLLENKNLVILESALIEISKRWGNDETKITSKVTKTVKK